MEEMKVIGIRRCTGKTDSGQEYAGYRFFVVYEQAHVDGYACSALWISDRVYVPVRVNDVIAVSYNRYGKVASYSVVE